MILENCILWDNMAEWTKEIYSWDTTLEISFSTIEGGQASISGYYTWGDAMIEEDPLFVTGNLGDHFLSQTAAGQAVDSPCVDTGNPDTPLLERTTRTDFVLDSGVIDMGWHYVEPPPEPPAMFLVAGPGSAESNPPLVRVFPPEQDAAHTTEFTAYGADSFGVNVTTGDVNDDGIDEILTGAGPGDIYGPHVRGFTTYGAAISELNFLAYGTNKYGVNVACGDLTGNGRDEIITGAGPGAVFGPHVRAFANTGTAIEPMSEVNFFAYGTPRWGVNVTAGDIDGDGYNEIVTGPGPSGVFGAHVRGWNYDGGTLGDIPGINFFAWPVEESLYGATVSAGADLNGDGRSEIIAGQGPDPSAGSLVKVFSFDGSQTSLLFDLGAFDDSGLTHGANATAGSY
jgi:hypothetical protein